MICNSLDDTFFNILENVNLADYYYYCGNELLKIWSSFSTNHSKYEMNSQFEGFFFKSL